MLYLFIFPRKIFYETGVINMVCISKNHRKAFDIRIYCHKNLLPYYVLLKEIQPNAKGKLFCRLRYTAIVMRSQNAKKKLAL